MKLSIDTYPLHQQVVQVKLHNRLLFVGLVVSIFFPSIPVDLSNRLGVICTMGYCTSGRNLKLSIDAYESDQ